MELYLYLVDESGAEIPGSRRDISGCDSRQEVDDVRGELLRLAGEGCTVMESEAAKRPLFDG